jgi:hypothetical protein
MEEDLIGSFGRFKIKEKSPARGTVSITKRTESSRCTSVHTKDSLTHSMLIQNQETKPKRKGTIDSEGSTIASNNSNVQSPDISMTLPGLPLEQRECDQGKKTLVLDLDETLIHSEFQEMTHIHQASLLLKIKGQEVGYSCFRPGVQEFLKKMTDIFEVVIFTASMSDYAD